MILDTYGVMEVIAENTCETCHGDGELQTCYGEDKDFIDCPDCINGFTDWDKFKKF